jgi:hypothetical protein
MIALAGCATMSADQCATADWRTLGFGDGSRGETLVKAARREDACADHGYAMDRTVYDNGRHAGLALYCTSKVAYGLGESGRSYTGVCVAHDEVGFLVAYKRGLELYAFTSAVSSAGSALRSAQNRFDELDGVLDKYSNGHRDEGLTTEEHNNLVLGIWAERHYLEKEAIPYWTYAHRYLEEQLDDYKIKVAAANPSIGSLQPRDFSGPEPHDGPTSADARAMLQEVLGALQQGN